MRCLRGRRRANPPVELDFIDPREGKMSCRSLLFVRGEGRQLVKSVELSPKSKRGTRRRPRRVAGETVLDTVCSRPKK